MIETTGLQPKNNQNNLKAISLVSAGNKQIFDKLNIIFDWHLFLPLTMLQLPLPSKVKISSDVLFQHIGGEYVLLNMNTQKYFGLDEIGALYWNLFAADADLEKAIEKVHLEYSADTETIKNDLQVFLQRLLAEELITAEK